jgi:cysteine desulfuration protein SufE
MPPPPTIAAIHEALVAEFTPLKGHHSLLLTHLLALGEALEPLSAADKCPTHQVHGCLSKVWIKGRYHAPYLHFGAESDALMTGGLLSLLVRLYSGQPPEAILQWGVRLPKQLGLEDILSIQRRSGLAYMVGYIQQMAEAFVTS